MSKSENLNKNKILILSPHTDDAELGCGGTIIKLLEQGKDIYWVVFSTAEDSLPEGLPKNILSDEFMRVIKKLNIQKYLINNFKVRHLHERRQEILEILIRIRNEFKPDLVIGPSLNDYHQDHIVIANEMVRAFKTLSSIICYELPWNHTTFQNQLFFKITKKQLHEKMALLNFYTSQKTKKREYFSEEFIKGLAKMRGVQINTEYAEAFEVIRWIN